MITFRKDSGIILLNKYLFTEEGIRILWIQRIYNNGYPLDIGLFYQSKRIIYKCDKIAEAASKESFTKKSDFSDAMTMRIYKWRKEYLERKGT